MFYVFKQKVVGGTLISNQLVAPWTIVEARDQAEAIDKFKSFGGYYDQRAKGFDDPTYRQRWDLTDLAVERYREPQIGLVPVEDGEIFDCDDDGCPSHVSNIDIIVHFRTGAPKKYYVTDTGAYSREIVEAE